ncbi:flagellar hook protein FlgE [Rhodoblastus acidophilus]|uniref:Flagellar hook protein FlgE n=1 Tax=Candidatus Rhodoblastus alkanivorans TaxID=2954117 RepID=A0ABS9Z3C9_9HYPH|nr:flagellar hook protein FlgE [Candidatus Rhodoblastus alkanivorans]MCI4678791.1 flagellar hook protein FlgE [Candidatus Rhodoblastus alkanivorans]MCI4682180.1 flagellar hook protein FlgE [Candidatus Rhodoblastus alkanivorans]MDI4639482.1 flagellar hook protein FlgE [Rhodoblastus acidophilus]
MGLYDAMNASVTGMSAQSNHLTNIGQNISNSSTVGYKQADTEFSTMVDQAGVGQTAAGGVIASTRLDIAQQGTLTGATSATDLAVSGSGFFVVSNAAGQQFLTRAGSFVADKDGNLVNAAGYYLNGYSLANGTPTMAANSLSGMQIVNVNSATLSATPTTSGTLTANLPSADSTIAAADLPSANSSSSTYDEKTSMVMYDNLGASHTIDVYFAQTASGTWEASAYDHSAASSTGGFPYSSAALATTTLSFDSSNGHLTSGSANSLSIPVPSGANMTLDLSGMTQLAGSFAVSTATVNGNAAASISSVTIGTDGALSYDLTNGSIVSAYKIPLASVASPDNLEALSGNVYSPNILSGQASVGTAGTGGLGTIQSNELEESTVDIATELTNMIVAQRGYQANAQMFKTGADLMNTLIQMNLT